MHLPRTVSAALAMSGLMPLEGKLLLAHVLGCDRAWLSAHGEAALTPEQARAFDALARRRNHGEPVAYLTGKREFFGLELEITPDVLIPRPETELLVELALGWLASNPTGRVLDLGCGSGAVALAIAHQRPAAEVLGADVSAAAIALARRNAERLSLANATFVESDWLARVPRERFAVIVANPPYVAEDDPHLGQGDLRYEPPLALSPGGDGLDAVRAIVAGAPGYLAPGAALAVEHGHDQAHAVRALLRDAGFEDVGSTRDLAGIERVSFGRTPRDTARD
ncbi:MAG TPA: peptide chain release factor N(5)-glutamine methyltransferase [Casimicrobiaceae bacterium]|nr:peptide chain release factor N(5)-glutamine methyltransferase [Casimicrobiaceae bacterium]